jgi:hypothetical protein
LDAGAVGHADKTAAEHGGRDARYRLAEAFPTCTTAHRFAAGGAGISEVQVLHGDRRDVMALGVADQAGDRVAHVGIPAC